MSVAVGLGGAGGDVVLVGCRAINNFIQEKLHFVLGLGGGPRLKDGQTSIQSAL